MTLTDIAALVGQRRPCCDKHRVSIGRVKIPVANGAGHKPNQTAGNNSAAQYHVRDGEGLFVSIQVPLASFMFLETCCAYLFSSRHSNVACNVREVLLPVWRSFRYQHAGNNSGNYVLRNGGNVAAEQDKKAQDKRNQGQIISRLKRTREEKGKLVGHTSMGLTCRKHSKKRQLSATTSDAELTKKVPFIIDKCQCSRYRSQTHPYSFPLSPESFTVMKKTHHPTRIALCPTLPSLPPHTTTKPGTLD